MESKQMRDGTHMHELLLLLQQQLLLLKLLLQNRKHACARDRGRG